jgi:Low-density lipoprotein receptor domain class A
MIFLLGPSTKCGIGEFKCKSGDRCIPESMVCDGDQHCPDGDDEEACSSCKNGARHCDPLKKCIPKWKICDGVADCPDFTDEYVSIFVVLSPMFFAFPSATE